jgi:E3 ubiquitin-protein ligase HERC4
MINSQFISLEKGNFYKIKNINRCSEPITPQIDNHKYVNDIACGEDHSLILDCHNDIWAFGLNYNGQLGLGHTYMIEGASRIPKFTDDKILKIESEGDISFAITEIGDVFMWPIRDPKKGHNILIPKKVKISEKIISVSCGGGFCIFLNENGMLYSWGRKNIYGQLGHGDTNPRFIPTLIEIFMKNNERISQVSCGFKHVVVKSFTNKAYSWGLVIY